MFKRIVHSALLVGLAAFALTAQDAAAQASKPDSSCTKGAAKLSDAAIKDFLGNPDALLTRHPVGGLSMTTEVRGIVATDSATADAMAGLAKKGNASQKASIGAGASQAIQLCVRERPEIAQQLQALFGQIADREFMIAFLSGANVFESAALGVGTGGAVGGALNASGSSGGGGGRSGSSGGSTTASSGGGSYSIGGGGSSYTDSRSVSRTR